MKNQPPRKRKKAVKEFIKQYFIATGLKVNFYWANKIMKRESYDRKYLHRSIKNFIKEHKNRHHEI